MSDERPKAAGPSGTQWSFDEADVSRLTGRGVSLDEARRQLDLLSGPPTATRIDRPAAIGDGMFRVRPDEEESLEALCRAAVTAGRVQRFVPASGAATRMFRDLLEARSSEAAAAEAAGAFLRALPRFPFRDELERALADGGRGLDELRVAGEAGPVLEAMLDEGRLAYPSRPKGLLPFHRYPEGPRTAVEEHLVEAASDGQDADGVARVHFTVSPEHLDGFRRRVEEVRASIERSLGARLEVTMSVQKPGTDTLALDGSGRPFRDEAGALLFRPSGHGALLVNLNELEADLVFIKNIDNVVPDRLKEPTHRWIRLLMGVLARTQERIFDLARRLEERTGTHAVRDEARAFLRDTLSRDPDAAEADGDDGLAALLDRPLRVCGMVPNAGEPGGGPFWVRGADGTLSLQIVEASQLDANDASQGALFETASHFNPVFLACGLRDRHGRPYDLSEFVDNEAVIVSEKSFGGRRLRALERPGLWNGAMARWNTVFVEVPPEVFNPVKTVDDLLRPEHQPA